MNRASRRKIESYLRKLKDENAMANDNGSKPQEIDMDALEKRILDQASSLARMRKRLFDEYVAAGFTEDHALQLCVK